MAAKFRAGEIDGMDAVRRHAVILEWGSGELLPKPTAQFRQQFAKRSAAYWS